MYTNYFDFDSKPFKPRDPRGFYRNAEHDAACAALLRGLHARQGFMLLTGEAGLGKTLILRRCMTEADDIRFVMLGNAHLDFPDILNYLCADLGLRSEAPDAEPQDRLLGAALAAYAGRGQTVALLLDDAHHLRVGALQQLWDFVESSAVAVDQRLQVVLAGLPDIEDKLRQPELHALQAAIQVRCRLERLNELETGLFIAHQLKAAGHVDGALLSPAVVERVAHYCQGVPRAIALLCDTVLLFASLQAEHEITPAIVDEAARSCFLGDQAEWPKPTDLEPPIASAAIAPPPIPETPRRRWSWGFLINGLTLAALTAAAVIWLWPSKQVLETQPPTPYSLDQRGQQAQPPGASPPAASLPASAAMPPTFPASDSPVSGMPDSENQPVLPIEPVTTPLTPSPVSTTQPQSAPEIKPQATSASVNKTRSPRASAPQASSRTTGQQARRIQSQPRVAKPRKAATAKRLWTRTVRNPWERPTATGFNQK